MNFLLQSEYKSTSVVFKFKVHLHVMTNSEKVHCSFSPVMCFTRKTFPVAQLSSSMHTLTRSLASVAAALPPRVPTKPCLLAL